MNVNNETGNITLTVKDSRVLTYLNARNKTPYVNTGEENLLMELWRDKYYQAKSEYEASRANSKMVKIWRNAYIGKFMALDEEGNSTEKLIKPIRKLAYELVDCKVNSHIPAPKMSPRYHSDITPVNATENLLKHETDKMLSEQVNDKSEHNVLIDGSSWFKVTWNPFDNTHERSGNPIVKACPVDTVFPQPGVENYKDLEYIFEETTISLSKAIDMYNRELYSPTNNDIIPIVNTYFLNEDGYVGLFTWCEETGQVLCNDLEWGIRKIRKCSKCKTTCNDDSECPICGNKDIRYFPMKEIRLQNDLKYVTNPYRVGDSLDKQDDTNMIDETQTIPKGTSIPHYLIRQLPFVPYIRSYVPNSIYGIGEIELALENQDLINKLLINAEEKSAESTTIVTKFRESNFDNSDNSRKIKVLEVGSPEEAQAIQVKQVMSDIQQEMAEAQVLYDIAKSTSGITNTDQGKADTTARSGKAKQLQMQASAERKVGANTLRNAAYSGVYELLFKNMLAYCDEERSFVKLLPDGTQIEEVWSRYMFLEKDSNGEYYYRDDFAWSVDTATEITEDRASMWQLIDNDFLNGTMGNELDPARALMMYWHMKDQTGYPLAKFALDFLKDSIQHLPTQTEQVLAQHPEAVQMALSFIQDQQNALGQNGMQQGQGQGGARANAGRKSDNTTKAAYDARNNNANRAAAGQQTNSNATKTGGMQGGTQ